MAYDNAEPPAYNDAQSLDQKDTKSPVAPDSQASQQAIPSMPATRVYHPMGEPMNSPLLSAEEMACIDEGQHIPGQSFGLLGLLAAVLWFPMGVGVCLLDRRVKCKRCGKIIADSCCSSTCDF